MPPSSGRKCRFWVMTPCSLVGSVLCCIVLYCRRVPSSERRNYLGEKWPMNFA